MAKKTISWPLAGSICFLVGICSCSTPQDKLPEQQRVTLDTIALEVSFPAPAASVALPRTNVRVVVSMIDSIYRLVGHSLDTQTVKLSMARPYHLLMFDHAEAENYFEYLTFGFLEYRSSGAADSAFARVEALTVSGTLRTEDTEKERQRAMEAERIFSKAGSTFLLLGNVIMHHERRCNYSGQDARNEERLVDALFNHYPGTRMMQGLCGYGPVRRRP